MDIRTHHTARATPSGRPSVLSPTRPRLALTLLAGCAIAISACGSSSSNTPLATTSSSYNADVKTAQCMRSHGVPNFPDPTAAIAGQGTGGFSIQNTPGSTAITINGISLNGPAYTAAAKTCHLSAATQPPGLTAAQQQQMVAKAHCIRTHSVPNFPDPTFGPNGHGVKWIAPAGFHPQAPAFLTADKVCAHVGANIPGVP